MLVIINRKNAFNWMCFMCLIVFGPKVKGLSAEATTPARVISRDIGFQLKSRTFCIAALIGDIIKDHKRKGRVFLRILK